MSLTQNPAYYNLVNTSDILLLLKTKILFRVWSYKTRSIGSRDLCFLELYLLWCFELMFHSFVSLLYFLKKNGIFLEIAILMIHGK